MIRRKFMLDTITVSHVLKRQPNVARRVVAVPMASLCISAITAGELLYGLARRPDAVRLQAAVTEFMLRVDVLQWDSQQPKDMGSSMRHWTVPEDRSDRLTFSSPRTPWPWARCW